MKPGTLPLLHCAIGAFAFVFIAIFSCNKTFDAPPGYLAPDITPTASIQTLKALHRAGSVDSLTTEMIISGVVIANDSSGNFYKQIIIQDSTGGIAIDIDDYNLYASFPVGRQVFVKLKGLYMSEDAGLLYLGGTPDAGGTVSGIASRLKDQFLVKGDVNKAVTPAVVGIADLKNNPDQYMYTLVQFQNFQVKDADTLKTFANATATSKSDANIIVKGCDSKDTMIIRTSGYSSFANVPVPKGNGTLTAVYAYYKSPYNSKITPQVIIRDTSDLQFTQPRCSSTTPPVTTTMKSIQEIRDMYKGSDVTLGAYSIGGVVISDVAGGNVAKGLVVLQDGGYGISVYFGDAVTYKPGDSLVVDVKGKTLKSYNGSLEIDAYGASQPPAVASGKIISPKEMTIANFNTHLSDIEYTLVKIRNAVLSGGSVYSGNLTLTDATDSAILYTANTAAFANSAIPSNAKDWVGYGSRYKDVKQFQIRNTSDITEAAGSSTEDTTATPAPPTPATADLMFSEYVEGSSNNKYIELYNAGTSAVFLADYVVRMYANGSASPTNSAVLDTLTGMDALQPGGIVVIQHPQAALLLPAGVTAFRSAVCNFNGDDALTLEKSGVIIDVFGAVGTDPGSSWTVAGDASAAADHTLRRLLSVITGNTNWASSSTGEWELYPKDDVSGLGKR